MPSRIASSDGQLQIRFNDGSRIGFKASRGDGFGLFRLTSLDLKTSVTGMRLPNMAVPAESRLNSTLNSAFFSGNALGIISASPEVLASNMNTEGRTADLQGCSHTVTQVSEAKQGAFAAEFISTCTLSGAGWSMQGRRFNPQLSRESIAGLKAWIFGDGKAQQLKFQLTDEGGGATDYYVPIDFTGWREVTMTVPAYHNVQAESVNGLNLYYNGVPARTTVRCLVDDVRALVSSGNTTSTVNLENFEAKDSPWWNNGSHRLSLLWDFNYARVGDAFGIIACPEEKFFDVIRRFETAAEIITPCLDGVWNKKASSVKESYLFLTAFSENQFDEALALAKRGGFKWVLLEQHSWCKSTGHYDINEVNFNDGLAGLVRTVNRFREHDIKVGLHLLGASIDNNDPYLSPVPDERLVKDALTHLTSPLDPHTTTIIVDAMPAKFPAGDGGYTGDGTVLQIGSELVNYESRTTTAPYNFYNCTRGHLGTKRTAHPAGKQVHHLARSYGYHMMNMDTSMLNEVTSNFAAVANACNIDMMYLDGAERLQGEHQRYNPRLVNAYLSKLQRKNILVQASSFSHFSWHQLARTASADGHGDLKGYLEQRASNFQSFNETGIPLDIGWYYGYDTSATPDMFEYILGTTIGYNSSFSYQVSVQAAQKHPFTNEILELINRYEQLRLSGRVSDNIKQLLRVPRELLGKSPQHKSRDNSSRRDYRLLKVEDHDVLQRVIYGLWQECDSASTDTQWTIDVTTAPALAGVQLQALAGNGDGVIKNPWVEINGHRLEWEGSVRAGEYVVLWPNEPARLYAANYKQQDASLVPVVEIGKGPSVVRFGCESGESMPLRVRVNLTCTEKHLIP